MNPRDPKLAAQLAAAFLPRVARVERLAGAVIESRLAPHGITLAQFRIIGALLGEAEGVTQRDLAARVRVDPATLSIALGKLEAAGMVVRHDDPDDARARRVHCASRVPHLGAVMGELDELEKRATRGIKAADLATASDVLARITRNLEAS